jgi:hypothetical protein
MWLLNCGNGRTNIRQSHQWDRKENDGNKHENDGVKIDMLGFKKILLVFEIGFFKSIVELFVVTGNVNTREL